MGSSPTRLCVLITKERLTAILYNRFLEDFKYDSLSSLIKSKDTHSNFKEQTANLYNLMCLGLIINFIFGGKENGIL